MTLGLCIRIEDNPFQSATNLFRPLYIVILLLTRSDVPQFKAEKQYIGTYITTKMLVGTFLWDRLF